MSAPFAEPWGIDRKRDLRRFLVLTRKLPRSKGFFLRMHVAFHPSKYVKDEARAVLSYLPSFRSGL